jgi:signal transduction histidine kinase
VELERSHSAWILASVITVASFVGATAFTQKQLVGLDELSSTIETNSVPSIDYLSQAAVRLTRLNEQIDEIAAAGPKASSTIAAARENAAGLRTDVDLYLRLPPLPGEQAFWARLRADVRRAIQLVDSDLEEGSSLPRSSPNSAADDVDHAIDTALQSVSATLEFDVQQSEVMARDVRLVRGKTLRTIIELDVAATLIALGAVVVAYRASHRHDRLVDEHNALLAARVTELDRFAGRVAHDVVNPLGAIAAGLSLIERSSDERARPYIDRSRRALQRVQLLVDDLLTFARAGARPDPASTCDIADALTTALADCTELAAQQHIELLTHVNGSARIACGAGVLTSIVQNLVHNAIKYIGPRPTRKIWVRLTVVGNFARIEIEDTGPGIPAEIRTTLFEPFVRGPQEQASGTGLGLATVRRLVQSHGGRLGFDSNCNTGTLFWVELPTVREEIGKTRRSA